MIQWYYDQCGGKDSQPRNHYKKNAHSIMEKNIPAIQGGEILSQGKVKET